MAVKDSIRPISELCPVPRFNYMYIYMKTMHLHNRGMLMHNQLSCAVYPKPGHFVMIHLVIVKLPI